MVNEGESLDKITECEWVNLAPYLPRQRLLIEAMTEEIVKPELMSSYLLELANAIGMEVIINPITYSANEMGFGGGIYWKSSGAHIHSYYTKPPLVTVDIYTCKPFDIGKVIRFTQGYFSTKDIKWIEIKV